MISVNDDLDTIFSTADFAETLSFNQVVTDGVVDVTGHFDEGSDAAEMYGVEIEAVKPTFTCRTTDAGYLSRGDTTSRSGTHYVIERIQKVGTGVSVAYLKTYTPQD